MVGENEASRPLTIKIRTDKLANFSIEKKKDHYF